MRPSPRVRRRTIHIHSATRNLETPCCFIHTDDAVLIVGHNLSRGDASRQAAGPDAHGLDTPPISRKHYAIELARRTNALRCAWIYLIQISSLINQASRLFGAEDDCESDSSSASAPWFPQCVGLTALNRFLHHPYPGLRPASCYVSGPSALAFIVQIARRDGLMTDDKVDNTPRRHPPLEAILMMTRTFLLTNLKSHG